jgi:hypothetical protein
MLASSKFYILIIKFLLFMVSVSIFVALGTMTIHEMGHVIVSRVYGCTTSQIIFNFGELPYTEVGCIENTNMTFILLAGLISTSIISIVMFFSGRYITRYISGIIFSIGLLASTIDLYFLNQNIIIITIINIIAYLLLVLSIIKISMLYFKEYFDSKYP